MSKTRYAQLNARLKKEYAPEKHPEHKLELKDRATCQDLYKELTAKNPKDDHRGMKYWSGNPVNVAEFPAIYAGYEVKKLSLELYERRSALDEICTCPWVVLSCLCVCLPLCVAACIDGANLPTNAEKDAITSLVAALEASCVEENIVEADAPSLPVVSTAKSFFFSFSSKTKSAPISQNLKDDERKAPLVDQQKAETKSAIEQEALNTIAAISRTSLLITNAGVKNTLAGIRVHIMNIHHINFDDPRLFGNSAQAATASERTLLLPKQPLSNANSRITS